MRGVLRNFEYRRLLRTYSVSGSVQSRVQVSINGVKGSSPGVDLEDAAR